MLNNEFNIGKEYKETFILTERIYKAFQECSGDMNPLHTDEIFAKNKGFHDKVMYGNILNAFISYFIGECLSIKDIIIHSQEISYKKAVYLNDRLRLEAIVGGIYESVNAVVFKFKFINQHNEMVAKGNVQIGILL
ncbi:(R)-specific enoyl-CoA hydratase [termite gut metagenome]|uniref:(R)-specific enoyl-CoA hydratase n=1 Tax=termite gut metagenome TaxID=433724 RepID=A0A5J4QNL7_9ZZZZ